MNFSLSERLSSGPWRSAGTERPLLRDRYELLDTVGAGGEGRVVKALDHQHDRLVALKIRRVGFNAAREELLREARVLLGIPPHPALPLVREDFFEGDDYLVVMDWVDGTDLGRIVQDRGTPGLAPSSVLAYLAEAAEALGFLHSQQPPVVHGDIKPSNLILTRGGRVKVVDFGMSSVGGTGRPRAGTPAYRAPELAAGGGPTRASDVYSLAATAFALLTGSPPAGVVPPWDRLGIPAELGARVESALRRGLATDPAHRPRSPGELVEQIRAGWDSTLPTGVVTHCVTEIDRSGELWEADPAAMAESLVRHDDLIARIVEAHGGSFVKASGGGDTTSSAFPAAGQAVRAAIELVSALSAERWPEQAPIAVRVGVHTGETHRQGGRYQGPTVNLAARVCSEANPREVLLSSASAAIVEADLPVGYKLVALGPHTLRGVAQPEGLHALSGPYLWTPVAGDAPYRGLLPFGPGERHLFFGREEVVADLLARVAPARLLAVVGPSGSGKTSLLRAGVLAAALAGELPGVSSGRLVTPGREPPLDLDDGPGRLLIVDQFEELYTQCRDPDRRSAFTEALLGRAGPVVIGIRADFYGGLSANARLAAAVAANQVLLGPMGDDDLRRAIAEPAELCGLRVEPGLIDLVVRDVRGEPGALPLMSHALRATWERRDGRTLSVDTYRQSGGVSSAIAQTADAVVASTPAQDRQLLREMFLRMTDMGEAEGSRRRVAIDELVPLGASRETVRALLERLSDARLVTLGEGTAEVAHEVLIRRWPTLRQWLEEDREGFRLHRRLGDAARLWAVSGRENTDLYRGTRLDAAVEWASLHESALNRIEREFLNASIDDSAQVRARQAKANRRLRQALVGSATLLTIALALVAFALLSRSQAVHAKNVARSEAIAAAAEGQVTRDPQRALLLARVALATAPTAAADLAATEALDANTARAQLPSFGVQACETANYMYLLRHGTVAVDNTCDGRIVYGDLVHRRLMLSVRIGHESTEMILTPDQRLLLASGSELLQVPVWGAHVTHLYTAPFPIVYAALSPSGRTLALTDGSRLVLVSMGTWRIRNVAIADGSVNGIIDLGWAGPHTLLVETSGQTQGAGQVPPGLSTIDLRRHRWHRIRFPTPRGELTVLSFLNVAPDRSRWFITGTQISQTTGFQQAFTWGIDGRSQRVAWTAPGPIGGASDPVAPSPDGRLVAVGYSQGTIDVLDGATGRLVSRDTSSSSIVAGWLQFPPGDSSLVTVTLDGVYRVWAARGSEVLRLQASEDPVLGFTPNGRDLVLLGSSGELLNWRTGKVVGGLPDFPASSVFGFCTAACVSATPTLRYVTYLAPNTPSPRIVELDGLTGTRLAAVDVQRLDAQGVAPDGRIVAAYVDRGQIHAELIAPLTHRISWLQPGPSANGCAATAPSFTPDTRLMAIVDGCTKLDVWNLSTGRLIHTVMLPDRPNASGSAGGGTTASGAQMTPGGRYVLVTVEGGGLIRADLQTGHVDEIPGSATVAKALAVSPNGRWYALGRQDGTVDEYDARSLQLVRHHVLPTAAAVIGFSPNSRWLAVEDATHVVRVWDTCDICESPGALALLAQSRSVRSLTPGERSAFGVGS